MNNEFNRINENIISFNNNDTTEKKNNNYQSYSEKKNFNDFQIDYKHYSELCEKRIKQLCPNQTFPITMEDLSKNNCLTSMEVKYQLKETQIMKLENELQDLRNKCSLLKEQNKQMIESREKIFKTLKEQKDFLIFPPPDRIPCEKLYEGYSKLYEAFNKISNDKQVAIVSLQNEILINDQQRNYIEILKQTLESNLIKNGIKSQIEIYNKIQKKKNSEECVKNLDNMCECYEELFNVVGLNQKIEDLYKQNNALEIENNKLKSDINDLKNRNNVFREQINDSLKIGIKELEQAKYKIKDLEGQKKDLINENNMLKEYNEKFRQEIENYKEMNYDKNNDINVEEFLNKYNLIKDEYQNLKNNFDKNQNDNKLLIKKNQEQKEEIEILRQENESLVNEINNLKVELSKSKENQYLSFSNNNEINEESYKKNSLNSLSMKVNTTKFESRNDNNINEDNINIKDIFIELKNNIHNCLINSNEFIQYCLSKYKENESIEEEINRNEIWNTLINSLTYLSELFQKCYNILNNFPKIDINNNTNNINFNNNYNYNTNKKIKTTNHSSLKKTNDNTPKEDIKINDSFKLSESEENNNNVINNNINNEDIKRNQELLFELEKYKEDNRIIYKNYKKLERENIELFFVNKENKFYYKLISRMLQYHINDMNVKNIINKLVLLNGKAISLDIEKNKIKIKIDDIAGSLSASSMGENNMNINSKFFMNNDINNSDELDKLKQIFSRMEKELNEKYIILKNLDKELKSFEINQM
jgi:hypothetical protein